MIGVVLENLVMNAIPFFLKGMGHAVCIESRRLNCLDDMGLRAALVFSKGSHADMALFPAFKHM